MTKLYLFILLCVFIMTGAYFAKTDMEELELKKKLSAIAEKINKENRRIECKEVHVHVCAH